MTTARPTRSRRKGRLAHLFNRRQQLIHLCRPRRHCTAPAPSPGAITSVAEPELNRLSNILKAFNDQFGNIPWSDADRVHKLITEDIPNRVAADKAYQNARQNSDKQNARIEHDKALARVMTAVLKDDTELFKQFMDNESFRRWLTDTVFGLTYSEARVG